MLPPGFEIGSMSISQFSQAIGGRGQFGRMGLASQRDGCDHHAAKRRVAGRFGVENGRLVSNSGAQDRSRGCARCQASERALDAFTKPGSAGPAALLARTLLRPTGS